MLQRQHHNFRRRSCPYRYTPEAVAVGGYRQHPVKNFSSVIQLVQFLCYQPVGIQLSRMGMPRQLQVITGGSRLPHPPRLMVYQDAEPFRLSPL